MSYEIGCTHSLRRKIKQEGKSSGLSVLFESRARKYVVLQDSSPFISRYVFFEEYDIISYEFYCIPYKQGTIHFHPIYDKYITEVQSYLVVFL